MFYRILIIAVTLAAASSCTRTPSKNIELGTDKLVTNPFDKGTPIQIIFEKGKQFYHPLLVFWIEDEQGNYIQTLYASQSIATGVFPYGVNEKGKWKPGERRRAAALPYWGHKRGFKAPDGLFLPTPENPLPDAISGATPKNSFEIKTIVQEGTTRFRMLMEVNQIWDWNNHWHNNRYPDDEDYKTSGQPAIVYSVNIDLSKPNAVFELKPIGHSHPSGKTGDLFTDLNTLTTALEIVQRVYVKAE